MIHFKTFLLLPAFALTALITQSCKKEEDKKTTSNSGTMVFWQTNATMTKYKTQGVNYYTIYINGVSRGEAIEEYYWSSAPPCGATHALTITQDLGTAESNTYNLTIRDNNSNILIESTINISKDNCTAYEIK